MSAKLNTAKKSKLERRDFIRYCLMTGAFSLLPTGFIGCGNKQSSAELNGAASGTKVNPALNYGLDIEQDLDLKVIEGNLPTDLAGHYLAMSCIPFNDGEHLFAGDGIMYNFSFDSGKAKMKSRHSKPISYYADRKLKGTDSPFPFTTKQVARFNSEAGFRESVNTAFVAMDKQLLGTTDGGRPYMIDEKTLNTLSPVGKYDEWLGLSAKGTQDEVLFPNILSSAHPAWDHEDKLLYTVHPSPASMRDIFGAFTDIITWDGKGELKKWKMLDENDQPISLEMSAHQVCVTKEYFIILDAAFALEVQNFVGGGNTPEAQIPKSAFYFIAKKDLKDNTDSVKAKKIVVDREAVHFSVDYLNDSGKVTLHVSHNCASDASEWIAPDDVNPFTKAKMPESMHGFAAEGTDIHYLAKYLVNVEDEKVETSKLVKDDNLTWTLAFYSLPSLRTPDKIKDMYWASFGFNYEYLSERVLDVYKDYPYRTVAVEDLNGKKVTPKLMRYDAELMEFKDHFDFGSDVFISSPQYFIVEDGPNKDKGYCGVTISHKNPSSEYSTGKEIWIFNAQDLKAGPICKLAHPEMNFAFTLHSIFLPKSYESTLDYRVNAEEDCNSRLKFQTQKLQDFYNNEVLPAYKKDNA